MKLEDVIVLTEGRYPYDELMIPVIKHLRKEGVKTISSCAGHSATELKKRDLRSQDKRARKGLPYSAYIAFEKNEDLMKHCQKYQRFIVDGNYYVFLGKSTYIEGDSLKFDRNEIISKKERDDFLKCLMSYKAQR